MVSSSGRAAFLRDIPTTLVQPDGTTIACFLTGDEYFRWAHDADGYVILQDPVDGRYVYAETEGAEWRPSPWTVGSIDPAAAGLRARPPIPAEKHRERRAFLQAIREKNGRVPAPSTGTLQNVVIFLRFSDQTEYTDPLSQYDAMCNAQESGANSMSRFYQEVSQGQFDVRSNFFPTSAGTVVSYQSQHPRGYYQQRSPTNPGGYSPDNDGIEGYQRLHALFQAAVQSIAAQVPPALNVDYNGDNYVDNVVYIAKGPAANWGDALWPHQWEMMQGYPCFVNNKQVKTYNFQLQDVLNNPQVGNGVLCHEMFHALGAPDLYRYETGSGSFFPVWTWDTMENTTNPPQHMLMHMKRRYGGWLPAPTVITQSGTYTLNPVTASTDNWYRIDSPVTSQYFLVEYRQQSASMFEANLPGSGLIVYRVNTAADGNGNAFGPPDEVLVYRPGGDNSTNGIPDLAHFNASVGRSAINAQTDPAPILADGAPGELDISNIGTAGATISFTVTIGSQPPVGCQTQSGDASGDNQVNIFDVIAVVNDILQTAPLSPAGRACADMNNDQSINIFDVVRIVNRILNPWPGEPSASGRFADADLAPVAIAVSPAAGALRVAFADARVHGIEFCVPWTEGGGTPECALRSGDPRASLAASVIDGTLRLVAYRPDGGPLGEGEVVLELPIASRPTSPFGGPELRVLLADGRGDSLPVDLRVTNGSDAPPALVRLAVQPNPARGEVRITLDQPSGRGRRIALTDVAGRRVREWTTGPTAREVVTWDGTDARGDRVRSGVYFVSSEGSPGRRLLLLR